MKIFNAKITQLILVGLFFCNLSKAQDQIVFLNGDKIYVDQIMEIQNDSLVFVNFKKVKKISLTSIKGYFLTIDTKENLKKGFYKREREYIAVDSSYHFEYYDKIMKEKGDVVTEYILSNLPENYSQIDYKKGFYVTYMLDTVYCLISKFENSDKNNSFFIEKVDSLNYQVHTPQNILSYTIGDSSYLGFFLEKKDDIEIFVFLYKEISGNINLYLKPELPYCSGNYYIINKKGTEFFYKICPTMSCFSNGIDGYNRILVPGEPFKNSYFVYVPTKPNFDNNFKELMPYLVNDCLSVVNKIKNGFYTKRDIKQIVNEYNDCCSTGSQKQL